MKSFKELTKQCLRGSLCNALKFKLFIFFCTGYGRLVRLGRDAKMALRPLTPRFFSELPSHQVIGLPLCQLHSNLENVIFF